MKLMVCLSAVDRSELRLWRGLHKHGVELLVTCSPGAPRYAELCESQFRVEPVYVKTRLDFKASSELRRLVREFGPDVLYAPSNKPLAAALRATRGTSVRVMGYRGTIGHLSRWDPAAWITYFHPRLSHIVSVSEAVRRYLCEEMRFAQSRVTTIYKGHDPAWYADPDSIDLAQFNIPGDAFVVGFAGNMRPVKGVDVLLRAAKELPADSGIHLLLIGEVRDDTVSRLAADRSIAARAHFVGYRSDAPALIAACDAFAMPSVEREGLPRAVFEAMAHALPVIVSDVGGMPEQVIAEETGIVVPPRDATALSRAMQQLAADSVLCESLGAAGRQRLASEFHISRTIDQFNQLILRVISS